MASTQQKSERAEAAAKQAAKDLEQVNREKEFGGGDANQKRGVIGSVLSAVRDTYENAKEAVVGKRDPTAPEPVEVTRVVDDVDVGRTGEVRDISAGKSTAGMYDSTKDATGRAGLKVGEYVNYAGEKTGEYKDYTADKAKDITTGKLSELRDSAAEAAKKAMGYLSGKKDEAKEGTAETMEGAKQRAWEAKEAAKEKLSAEEETRSKMEELKVKDNNKGQRGDDVSIKVKQTPPGAGAVAVAEALKASDQMSGQTFNDVGSLDNEAQAHVRVERRHK